MRFDPEATIRWMGRHAILMWGFAMSVIAVLSLLATGEINSEIVVLSFAPFAFVLAFVSEMASRVGLSDQLFGSRAGAVLYFILGFGCYALLDFVVLRWIAAYKTAVAKAKGGGGASETGKGKNPALTAGERMLIWVGRHPILVWAIAVCLFAPPLELLHIPYDADGFEGFLFYTGGFICLPFFALMSIIESLGIDRSSLVSFLVILVGFFVLCLVIDLKLDRSRRAWQKAAAENKTSQP